MSTAAPKKRTIRGLDAEARRELRRETLLESALTLFADQGYTNTPIEQICQHAYVGTKSFYESFASRDELYVALLRKIADGALAKLATLAGDRADEDKLPRELLEAFAHTFVDDLRVAKVIFGEGSAITPDAERQRRANRRAAAELVEHMWSRFGDPVDHRHHAVAIGLIGALFDIMADWTLDRSESSPSAEAVNLLILDLVAMYEAVRFGMNATPSVDARE